MKRFIFAAIAMALLAPGAFAQTPAEDQPLCAGCPTPAQLRALAVVPVPQGTVAVPAPSTFLSFVPPATPPAVVAPPPAAPATQNTITTTAPVTSSTSISVGTLAGQFLTWIVAAFSVPIGSIAVWIMVRVLKNLGITATDAMRARLQEMVVNALNVSAPVIEQRLAGKGQIEIHDAVVQSAVAYVQAHGADEIKKLGLDPQSGLAVEAIKARIETAINDPTVATPAVLATPTPPAAKA